MYGPPTHMSELLMFVHQKTRCFSKPGLLRENVWGLGLGPPRTCRANVCKQTREHVLKGTTGTTHAQSYYSYLVKVVVGEVRIAAFMATFFAGSLCGWTTYLPSELFPFSSIRNPQPFRTSWPTRATTG